MEDFMKTMIFKVDGIKCGGCAKKIKTAFEGSEDVSSVDVSVDEKEVTIMGETFSGMGIKSIIEDLGFEVMGMKKA